MKQAIKVSLIQLRSHCGETDTGGLVSWNWGSGKPSGKVAEVKEQGELVIESKGKEVKKNASPDNPAVRIERSGNPVVKRASELNKEGGGSSGKKDSSFKAKAEKHDDKHEKGKGKGNEEFKNDKTDETSKASREQDEDDENEEEEGPTTRDKRKEAPAKENDAARKEVKADNKKSAGGSKKSAQTKSKKESSTANGNQNANGGSISSRTRSASKS